MATLLLSLRHPTAFAKTTTAPAVVVAWSRNTTPRREKVLFVLGGPDAHTVDGSKFVYSWSRIAGYFLVGGIKPERPTRCRSGTFS